jgi:uncharacterized protein
MTGSRAGHPALSGVGLGLRWDFLDELLEAGDLPIAFFEVSPENYMRRGGWYPAALERVRERYPIVTHGLTMSLGAIDPPPDDYLQELSTELGRVGTPWHSDHLCFSSAGGVVLHELMPLKLCQQTVDRVADRVRWVEDRLKLPIAIENISWYAHPGKQELPEAEVIGRVLEKSGCGLLLDVNNVWVNAQNHGFDPYAFIASLPLERVVQIHVAGHWQSPSGLIIDTHGAPVAGSVHELLGWTLERTGPLPVLLERDNEIPPLAELLEELRALGRIFSRAMARRAQPPASGKEARASGH